MLPSILLKPETTTSKPVAIAQEILRSISHSQAKRNSNSNSIVPQESLDSHRSSVADDKKISELKAHTGYTLHVHLKQGHDLPAKDACGTSDPYVKFLFRGKQVYKSKTIFKDLNPFWDEKFTLIIDDPFVPIEIKVRQKFNILKL